MTETGNVHQKITLRSQAPTSKIRSARNQLFPLHAISNDFFGVWEKEPASALARANPWRDFHAVANKFKSSTVPSWNLQQVSHRWKWYRLMILLGFRRTGKYIIDSIHMQTYSHTSTVPPWKEWGSCEQITSRSISLPSTVNVSKLHISL